MTQDHENDVNNRTPIPTDGTVRIKCLVEVRGSAPIGRGDYTSYIKGYANKEYVLSMKYFLNCCRCKLGYGFRDKVRTIEVVRMWFMCGKFSSDFMVTLDEFHRVFGFVPSSEEETVVENEYGQDNDGKRQ